MSKYITELMDAATTDHTDDARLGLAKEMLQVVLGLEPETLDRVMRLIRGSEDAQDIKTPEMRQRIGNRAIRYLRNAIDLAREEGTEYHNKDPDIDMSKEGEIEPGHKHSKGISTEQGDNPEIKEMFTFKDYLKETRISVDTEDPDAMRRARTDMKMNPQQLAMKKRKEAMQGVSDAGNMDADNPNANEERSVAADRKKLVDKENRLDRKKQQQMQGMQR